MRPGGIAVSPTLGDIERLVLLHSDQLARLQVSFVQTLGVEMSVGDIFRLCSFEALNQ